MVKGTDSTKNQMKRNKAHPMSEMKITIDVSNDSDTEAEDQE